MGTATSIGKPHDDDDDSDDNEDKSTDVEIKIG